MEYVLETDNLQKSYGRYRALGGLTMQVPRGAIYGLVGRNGAGKTTLIRQICGLQTPDGGTYRLYGAPAGSGAIFEKRRRMGAVVETPSIYRGLTAHENLREQYRVLGLPSFSGVDELLSLVGLSDTGRKKAGHFSLGMRQRLGIAVALCGDPDFLVLDEPTNGLDPQGIIEMRELILRLNRERGITVLISSHILDELARLATHYGFVDGGCMVRQMSAEDLERACRKCVRLTVTDAGALCRVLEAQNIEYAVTGEREADVYGEFDLTALVLALSEAGCRVTGFHEHDETLESFYIGLVGGERHA